MARNSLILDRKTAWIFSLAVFLFVADRGYKYLALADYRQNLIGGWLRFNFVENFGIAFSLPLGGLVLNWLILCIILGLSYFAAVLLGKSKKGLFLAVFGILLGSVSNLIDRVYLGYVVDYLDLQYFTVFNLADVLIVCSIGWIFIYGIDKK